MVTTSATTTIEEYERIAFDEARYELIDGELRRMPDAGFEHGTIGLGVGAELRAFVRPRGLGAVTGADTSYLLSRDERLVRLPDAAFVVAGRLPSLDRVANVFDGAPDLAVEVVSPTDSAPAVEEKVQTWLRFGTRLVWVLWPRTKTVTVRTPDGRGRTLGEGEELDGGDVLPGFSIAVAELFR
jgi:Uma2 family endonuclease